MLTKNSIIKDQLLKILKAEILIGFSEELYRKFCRI